MEDVLDRTKDTLRKSSFIIKDTANLVRFAISNVEDRDTDIAQENLQGVIEEALQNLSEEEQRLSELKKDISDKIDLFVQEAFDPLQPYRIVSSAAEFSGSVRDFQGKKVRSRIRNYFKKGYQSASDAGARLLYSISGGLLLAQQFINTKDKSSGPGRILSLVEKVNPQPDAIEKIPFFYQNLFSGRSNIGSDFWITMAREEKEFLKAIGRYNNGVHGAILVKGKRNQGKTAFTKFTINKYLAHRPLYNIFPPREGTISVDEFNKILKDVTGISGSSEDIIGLLPHESVVQIHDLELWWERSDQGLEIIQLITRLIDQYSGKCLFILSVNPFAFRLINRLIDFENYLIATIDCEKFSAENIKDLILLRHKSSGLNFNWKGRSESELTAIKTAQLFSHYFDYSKGNPGVALCGWLAHVTDAEGKSLTIKTPHVPDLDALTSLSADHRVALAQIIIHKRVSTEKLARIMDYNENDTSSSLRALKRSGLIVETSPGTFAMNIYIEPFVSQVLETQKLI